MIFRTKLIDRGLCLCAALALLVAVLTSPMRPSCASGIHARFDCPRRHLGIPPTHSPSSPSKSTALRVVTLVKAIRSESQKKEPGRAVCLVRRRWDLPFSPFIKALTLGPIGSRQALQPLRC